MRFIVSCVGVKGFTTHSRSLLMGVRFGVDVKYENAPEDFRGLDFFGVELVLVRKNFGFGEAFNGDCRTELCFNGEKLKIGFGNGL